MPSSTTFGALTEMEISCAKALIMNNILIKTVVNRFIEMMNYLFERKDIIFQILLNGERWGLLLSLVIDFQKSDIDFRFFLCFFVLLGHKIWF